MKSIPSHALTSRVIGRAIEVHRELGPGLVESLYETCLCDELADAGLVFARQRQLPVIYKGRTLSGHYQLDIVVDNALVLEVKAAQQVHSVHAAQLLTYLRIGDFPLGLLMNFNTALMKNGITRLLNPAASSRPIP
jgi:GxxExxY protein